MKGASWKVYTLHNLNNITFQKNKTTETMNRFIVASSVAAGERSMVRRGEKKEGDKWSIGNS